MKKLISILLTIVTLLSALAVMPSAGAETSSSEKTTYIPKDLAYSNKYGTVYVDGKDLVAESAKGEKVTLAKRTSKYSSFTFYMRGKKVIYYVSYLQELYSVGIDGKNKKELGIDINEFLGGYGDDVIVYLQYKGIYKINSEGKKIKLFGLEKNVDDVYIFGGRVYVNYYVENWKYSMLKKFTVYDLNTKKISTVKMYDFVVGQNHMYYTNKKKNLIQVDKNGVKRAVARNVGRICAVNNGATVVYSKPLIIGDKKYKTFYRKTKGLKTVKLGRAKDIRKKAKSILSNSKKYDMKGEEEYRIEKVTIGRNNAYFLVYFCYSESNDWGSIILPVNLNTGKIGEAVKVMDGDTDGYFENIRYENGYIYCEVGIEDPKDLNYPWDRCYRRIKAS